MIDKDCGECEKEAIQDLVDLQIDYDKLLRLNKILQKTLNAKEELCEFYRDENEKLHHQCKLWKEDALNLRERLDHLAEPEECGK